MNTCAACTKPVAGRYARYCREHRHGAGMPNYSLCPAMKELVKRSMMNAPEARYFAELCRQHKLSEKKPGEAELYVSYFLLLVQIRREAERVYAGRGDVDRLSRMIGQQQSLASELLLTPKSQCKTKQQDPLSEPIDMSDLLSA